MENNDEYSILLKLIKKQEKDETDNDILFFKIFRNKYIRSLITNYHKLTSNANNNIRFKSCEEFYYYKYKDNLTMIIIEDDNKPFIGNILTPSITDLQFGINFNQKLKKNDIPSIRKLKFSKNYNKILLNVIPSNVVELRFGNYNELLPINSIPESVIKLHLGITFNKVIEKGVLPKNLKELIIGSGFKQKLNPESLPLSLEKLEIGQNFNQTINNWCILINIKSLIFGNSFNNGGCLFKKDDLPCNLVELELGNYFEPFDKAQNLNIFPNTLEILGLNIINQSLVVGLLPSSIKLFECNYNLPLLKKDELPIGLQILKLSIDYNYPLTNSIPSSLNHLETKSSFNQVLLPSDLPTDLLVLKFGYSWDKPLPKDLSCTSIKELVFGFSWNQIPNNIPRSIKKLVFGKLFNKEIKDGQLPPTLNYLQLGYDFNFNLPILPPTLNTLILSTRFNKPLNGKLKSLSFLKILKFVGDFNQSIKIDDIPLGVIDLEFGFWFDQTIIPSSLPSSIIDLKFGVRFSNGGVPFELNSIPNSVLYLEFVNKSFKYTNLPQSIVSINNSFL